MRVLSGSLRRDSYNVQLLRAAAELLPAGVDFSIHEGIRDIPHYDADLPHVPGPEPGRAGSGGGARRRRGAGRDPEYNHSIPGALKNALDWLSRPLADSPLRGKPNIDEHSSTVTATSSRKTSSSPWASSSVN